MALRSRTATRLAICLILGAIINFLIAGACSLWPFKDFRETHTRATSWRVPRPESWPEPVAISMYRTTGYSAISMWGGDREIVYTKRGSFDYGPPIAVEGMHSHYLHSYESGWPLRSFRAWSVRLREHRNAPWIRHWGFDGSALKKFGITGGWGLIPYFPIPLGFAVNTLFYAAILFIPFTALSALKRRSRSRRGLCTRCAYDLAGLTLCPECGLASSPPGRGWGGRVRAPDLAPRTPSSLPAKSRSRAAARIVLCLILGAIINLVVAWTIALTPQQIVGAPASFHPINHWLAPVPDEWPAAVQMWETRYFGLRFCTLSGGESMSVPCGGEDYFGTHQSLVLQSGWPARSVMTWINPPAHTADWQWDLEIPGRQSNAPSPGGSPIPLLPIPLGFTLNTIFYGAILFTLCAAHTMTRRAIRVRKGRCPACGYDASDLPRCPECGHAPQPAAPAIAPT